MNKEAIDVLLKLRYHVHVSGWEDSYESAINTAIASLSTTSSLAAPESGGTEDTQQASAPDATAVRVPDSMIVLLNHLEDLMDQGELKEDAIPVDMWNAVSMHNYRIGYEQPAPSAPVGAEGLPGEIRNLASEFTDEGGATEVMLEWADRLERALAQQPAACDMGELCIGCEPRNADGSCPGQQPAAVDDLNAWRAAFVVERAMRYRKEGMTIEQARIHAETDAARMAALAAGQQQGGPQE